MAHRRFRAPFSCLFLLAAFGQADFQWYQHIDIPGPTLGSIWEFRREAAGNVCAVGNDGEPTLWKFNSSGAIVYQKVLPGAALFGKKNDVYTYGNSGLHRFSLATGELIWHQPSLEVSEMKVDETGTPYVLGFGSGRKWEKRSIATGNPVWKSSFGGGLLMTSGSEAVAYSDRSFRRLNKQTGELGPAIGVTLPTGSNFHIEWVALGGGKAVIVVAKQTSPVQYSAYGYSPDGTIITLPSVTGTLNRTLPDGSALVQWGPATHRRIDANFNLSWSMPSTGDWQLSFDSANLFCRRTSEDSTVSFERYPIASGGTAQTYRASSLENPWGAFSIGNSVWIGGTSHQGKAAFERQALQTAFQQGSWESPSEGKRGARSVAAAAMPNGELAVAFDTGGDLGLARISRSGAVRWHSRVKTAVPYMFGFFAGQTNSRLLPSRDGKHLSIWLRAVDGEKTLTFDAANGSLLSTDKPYALFDGPFAYRSFTYNGVAYTSKVERSTSKVLWRVPRSGSLLVDDQGYVYIGASKNDPNTGELIWGQASGPSILWVKGSRVFVQAGWDGNLGAIDRSTGAVLWTIANPVWDRYNSENESADLEVLGDMVLYRPGRFTEALAMNLSDGKPYAGGLFGNYSYGPWGAPRGAYYDAPGANYQIFRKSGFLSSAGTLIGDFQVRPQLIVTDPLGGAYAIGQATPHGLRVARW